MIFPTNKVGLGFNFSQSVLSTLRFIQFPDKRWSEQLKTDDIESHPETKEELKLYVVQRKFYHFLHGISDVLEPIRKIHSRSRHLHQQERVKHSRGDDDVFNEEESKEIAGKQNCPTSDSDADTSSSVHSESISQDHQQRVHQRKSASVHQNLESFLGSPEKLKSSIYKTSVMNYLERNLRNCKSSENVEDALDDNNNTDQHRDYNSSKENDGPGGCDEEDYEEDDEYEEGDELNEHRRRKRNAASTENMNLGQDMAEDENERAVANMKSMPKDEIKIMNFFNSIYNFNQQHSAHLKPPPPGAAFPRDQFEDSCKLGCAASGKWEDRTARFTILFRLQINRHRRIRKIVNYHRHHPRLLLKRRRKDSYRRRLSQRRRRQH